MEKSRAIIELLSKTKVEIKWNNFFADNESRDLEFDASFQIQPRDFLEYARQDLKQVNNRGKINAISNIKKAIDSQIDRVVEFLGYDYKNIDDNKELISQINQIQKECGRKNVEPFKLNFINALGVAPVVLISEIRGIRNKLEHEYIMPNELDIEKGLELAELFIDTTSYKMFGYFLQDYNVINEYQKESKTYSLPMLWIEYKSVDGIFKIRYYTEDYKSEDILVTNKDEEYIYLIKASISHDMYYLAKIFSASIPKEKVNYKIIKY